MAVMTTDAHEFLTVAEVAALLRCGEKTIRRRIDAGEIPAVQLGGRRSGVRVPRAALECWLWVGPTEEN